MHYVVTGDFIYPRYKYSSVHIDVDGTGCIQRRVLDSERLPIKARISNANV